MTVAQLGKAWTGLSRKTGYLAHEKCTCHCLASSRAMSAVSQARPGVFDACSPPYPRSPLWAVPWPFWRTITGPCWILQSRKKGLSEYSRRAVTTVCRQRLQAHDMWGPGASAGLPGQILPICFCRTQSPANWWTKNNNKIIIILITTNTEWGEGKIKYTTSRHVFRRLSCWGGNSSL